MNRLSAAVVLSVAAAFGLGADACPACARLAAEQQVVAIAAAADANKTRADGLRSDLASFSLELRYFGPQDKPMPKLRLAVSPVEAQAGPDAPQQLRITKDQAKAIIDALEKANTLGGMINTVVARIRPPAGPAYTLNIHGTGKEHGLDIVSLYEDIGFEAKAHSSLATIHGALGDSDAAKAVARIIAVLPERPHGELPPAPHALIDIAPEVGPAVCGPAVCGPALVGVPAAPPAPVGQPQLPVPPAPPVVEHEIVVQKDTAMIAANASNDFAFRLYPRIAETGKNTFFSPYSISVALAMTANGAAGATLTEMQKTLGFTAVPELDANAGHAQLAGQLTSLQGIEQNIANAVFVDGSFTIDNAYAARLKDSFGGGIKPADFRGDPEKSRAQINGFVSDATKKRIPELLAQGIVKKDTRLVLVNAIYFKAKWARQFDKNDTSEKADFTTAAGKKVTAPLMFQVSRFAYAEFDNFQAIELPYEGGRMAMLVLLPSAQTDLADLEGKLTADVLAKTVAALKPTKVRLHLPRFSSSGSYSLAEPLGAMGMPTAFTGRADFSRMTTTEPLMIGAVIHQANIDVTEVGTEAAAATAVLMAPGAAPMREPEPPTFRADRAFVYVLRDTKTGAILFAGRLADPTQK